jgi:hypothetical protein
MSAGIPEIPPVQGFGKKQIPPYTGILAKDSLCLKTGQVVYLPGEVVY